MVILVESVEVVLMSSMARRANSRMSSKTLPWPLVLENAHIHELLFKCAKTCSQLVSEDMYVVLPICVAYTIQLTNGWSATFIHKNGQSSNASKGLRKLLFRVLHRVSNFRP